MNEQNMQYLETEEFMQLKPNYWVQPTGVFINLTGIHEASKLMIDRLRTRSRPLERLLEDPVNVRNYLKVNSYVISARVTLAQDEMPHVAQEHRSGLGEQRWERTVVISLTKVIPKLMAWCFIHLGKIMHFESSVVPWIPRHSTERNTAEDFATGDFIAICNYIKSHSVGNDPIPKEDLETITPLVKYLDLQLTDDMHFTSDTTELYKPDITGEEWHSYTIINRAIDGIGSAIRNYDISDVCNGTHAAFLRYTSLKPSNENSSFYSRYVIDSYDMKAGIALRLGVDTKEDCRYTCDENHGVIRGSDISLQFLVAFISSFV